MSTRTPSLVCFGCSDIVNNQRTQVYVNWAQAQGKFDAGCCPKVDFTWCDEDDAEFTDPVTDEACWFDPNYPESADFLGVYVNDIDGLENDNYVRSISPNLGDGTSFGRGALGGKTLTFDVILFATSCAGLEWGRRWLQRTLRGSGCNHATRGSGKCGTHELKIRTCCPTDTGADAGIRIFPRVALTVGVVRADGERRDKCCDVYQRFTFVISTSTAAAFGELEDACIDSMPDPANQICFDWDGCIPDVTAGCNCTASCDGTCPEALFAPPVLVDDAPCGPYEQVTNCCCISGSASSSIGSAMVMDLFAGSDSGDPGFMQSGATDVIVRFYPNPKMLPCPTTEEELELFQSVSEVCAEINACRIPAGATLRIDSRTGEALLICEGNTVPVYDIVRGDLTKIQAGCYDVIACVTWNAWAVVYDPPVGAGAPSSFSIQTAARFE